MEQRLEFVMEHRSGTLSTAALCRLYGISTQTGHKWLNRFSPRLGAASLEEQSRRPLHMPAATDPWAVAKIVALRKRFPT